MNDTLFDRILAGTLPAEVVFENEHVLAFRDIAPQAPVHVLVIPRKRLERVSEIVDWNESDAGHFLISVAQVAARLGLDGNGYRIVINNGADAGQAVEYLHAHILGGRRLGWPPG